MGGDGMIHLGEAREMKRITDEYWNQMTDESTGTFNMDADVLAYIDETPQTRSIMSASGGFLTIPTQTMNVGFRGGRLRLK
jgi:hypothetical protein